MHIKELCKHKMAGITGTALMKEMALLSRSKRDSFLFKNVRTAGGINYRVGDAYLLFWSREGRVIQGNTVIIK